LSNDRADKSGLLLQMKANVGYLLETNFTQGRSETLRNPADLSAWKLLLLLTVIEGTILFCADPT